jgi:hypothetical protein
MIDVALLSCCIIVLLSKALFTSIDVNFDSEF